MVLFSSLAAALAIVSSVSAQCGSGTPDATVTVCKRHPRENHPKPF
jgi:hypothetical protein